MIHFVTSQRRFFVFVFSRFLPKSDLNASNTKMIQDMRKITADSKSGHLITPYSKIKILHRRGPLKNMITTGRFHNVPLHSSTLITIIRVYTDFLVSCVRERP